MQAVKSLNSAKRARREILALLAASLSCAIVLTLKLTENPSSVPFGGSFQNLLLLSLIGGAGIGALTLVFVLTIRAHRMMRQAREDMAVMKRDLMTANAIFRAEPQTLIYWEHGDDLQIITHTLTSVPGVPQDDREFLKFGTWLDPHATDELKHALDQLFTYATPFTLFLKTQEGGHLEADGRATGTRAVLRLRDVAGTKQDLVQILDQNRRMRLENRLHKALANALPLAIWLKNDTEEISWANSAFARAVDAQRHEEIYTSQLELLESRQRATVERALAQSPVYAGRMQLTVGGHRRPHDVFGVTLDGSTAAAAIDVADLVSAQSDLDRQVAAYDRTLDRVATPVAIFDRNQTLTFFNEAYHDLWGLDPGWLEQCPSDSEILDRLKEASLLPAMADYRAWRRQVLSCYGATSERQDLWQLPDGRTLNVLAAPRPDGGVTYIFEDVSERLALESRYNALFQVQRETLDSLKEGVAVFATSGRLQLHNKAFLSIWRLSRPRMEQSPHIDDVIRLTRPLYDRDEVWQSLKDVVTTIDYEREPLSGQMIRPDGSVIDFASTPLPDGGTLITFADVTASRVYERTLLERNEALEAADKLKSQFIGHVSYELRTPLTNIIGFNELLQTGHAGSLNAKQQEYLDDISQSSQTLLSIIDDILDLATIDAGNLELDLRPVDIRGLMEQSIQRIQERATASGITLEIAMADNVDTFQADEKRVRQILQNVLSNAVGFTDQGGLIRLSCWRERKDVVFAVEDNGVGIPVDFQDKVFERFESRSQGSRHRGAGLGLSIVRSLVDLHGGKMTLYSKPDEGTTVTVRLPRKARSPSAADNERGNVRRPERQT